MFESRAPAHVVTVSDRCHAGLREDASGPAAVAALEASGFSVTSEIVPDGIEPVARAISDAAAAGARLIVTTGGTGLAPRDLTPEGTRAVIAREVPGIAELLRAAPGKPHAHLSRGLAGTLGEALVVNLPGSPSAVTEGLATLLPLVPHILDQLEGGDH